MYTVSKRMEIAGAHYLDLPYPSKCTQLHGHNWVVVVECKAHELNDTGMVVDFAKVKKAVHGMFDHSSINEELYKLGYPNTNPTAENMARIIMHLVDPLCKEFNGTGKCTKVTVQESEGNIAEYTEGYMSFSNFGVTLEE